MPHYIENSTCPTCGGKMMSYYGPYCPVCLPKGKTKKNLLQAIAFIEHKYNIQTRDCLAKKYGYATSSTFNCEHEEKWKENFAPIPKEYITDPLPNYRFNQKGMDWYNTPEGDKFFRDRDEAYRAASDGKCKEIPYQDWWHLFVDTYEFVNDCTITINYQHLYDCCEHDWQREITQLFINEFGKRDHKVHISW